MLIGNDPLKRSDAAILLEGDGYARIEEAASLYKHRWVERVVFSGGIHKLEGGGYPKELILPRLVEQGVPPEHIIVEDASQHTWGQAVESLRLTVEHGWSRILLVASHYHQYRAYLTFLKVVLEHNYQVEVVNAPARQPTWFTGNDWGVRYDLLDTEFEKIEQYRESGHVASYRDAITYQRWKDSRT